MTCGIYILYYETDDSQYYVGKSLNIEDRYKRHCRELRNKQHKNKELIKGFNIYEAPTLAILEVLPCDDTLLYSREVDWISAYDSFHNGMNETPGGKGTGFGENSPRSKYSNAQILHVLDILVTQPEIPFKEVSITTGVPITTVSHIASGTKHCWLAEASPDKYNTLLSLKCTRGRLKVPGCSYPTIRNPEGVDYTVGSVRAFAREHGLRADSLCQVLNSKLKSTFGWVLAP